MAGAEISVVGGAGIDRLEQTLRRIAGAKFDNMLDTLGGHIVDQTNLRFKTKRRPDGSPWSSPKWSDGYAAWRKRKKKTRGGYLSLEGHLQQSIQHLVSFGGGVGTLLVGTNLDYAATHQYGDDRLAWGKHQAHYPARQFLGMSKANARELETEMRDWMRKLIRK